MIEEKLLRLERMTHAEKINHWGSERPWKVDGTTLKLPFKSRRFPPGHVQMDDRGNVTRSPFLVNRPCFGQVTAFLRHGGNGHVFCPKTGGYQPDRCSRCPVADACAFVCEKRLNCTPAIRELYLEWKSMGGRASSWPKTGKPGSATATLRRLLDALRSQTFTSDNDDRVQNHYETRINEQQAKERERKRVERVKIAMERASQGELLPEVKQVLNKQCVWRSERYKELKRSGWVPLSLKRSDNDTVTFDALVWMVAKRVEFGGDRPNPSNCASELQKLGLESGRTLNALRNKVGRSLQRIVLLETMSMPGDHGGGQVWPRFTIRHLREAMAQHTLQGNTATVPGPKPPITLQNPSLSPDGANGSPDDSIEKTAVSECV